MRLLINTIPLLDKQTGIGNYTRHIAQAARNCDFDFETTFFYGYFSRNLRSRQFPGQPKLIDGIMHLAKKGTLLRRICKKGIALGNRACNFIRNRVFDCYFEPNFLLMPNLHARRNIITVHDFSCFLFPQWHPAERVRQMEKNFWGCMERADKIITVSYSIQRQAVEKFGIAADRLAVIPNGVDHSLFRPQSPAEKFRLRQKYDLPSDFALFVGTVEPRKNLHNLLVAYGALPEALKKHFPLIIVGYEGWNNDNIMRLLRKQAEYVRFLGYVPEGDLPPLYGCATFFVYPSFYEGFGLPILEAMACGCPVLSSNDTALLELSGDAAHILQPHDVDDIKLALREMMEDGEKRAQLAAKGLARASLYHWQRSAQAHLQLFRSVCAC